MASVSSCFLVETEREGSLITSIDVDTSDSVVSAALGAVATGIGETTTVRGLKYSSN
nr:hypothetical protein [Tanacetum cinerariifolium]